MRSVVRVVLTLAAFALVLLAASLVAFNKEVVRLQLGVVDLPPLAIGLVAAAALGSGLVIGLLLLLPGILRRARRERGLRRHVGDLEREVRDLRALPLRGDG